MLEASEIANFEVTANDTVLEFEIGKKPRKVEVYNETNGAYGVWLDTMADAEFFVVLQVAGGAGKKTADGITIIDEASNDANGETKVAGFSLGKLADFNATADSGDVLQISVAY